MSSRYLADLERLEADCRLAIKALRRMAKLPRLYPDCDVAALRAAAKRFEVRAFHIKEKRAKGLRKANFLSTISSVSISQE